MKPAAKRRENKAHGVSRGERSSKKNASPEGGERKVFVEGHGFSRAVSDPKRNGL